MRVCERLDMSTDISYTSISVMSNFYGIYLALDNMGSSPSPACGGLLGLGNFALVGVVGEYVLALSVNISSSAAGPAVGVYTFGLSVSSFFSTAGLVGVYTFELSSNTGSSVGLLGSYTVGLSVSGCCCSGRVFSSSGSVYVIESLRGSSSMTRGVSKSVIRGESCLLSGIIMFFRPSFGQPRL